MYRDEIYVKRWNVCIEVEDVFKYRACTECVYRDRACVQRWNVCDMDHKYGMKCVYRVGV